MATCGDWEKWRPRAARSYSDLIDSLAGTAGFEVQKKGEATAIAEFDMGKGRRQTVWTRYLGEDRRGNSIGKRQDHARSL